MEKCLFCQISEGKIPSEKIYENEYVLAFKDIQPVAPVHVLIIPKFHIADYNDINENNINYILEMQKAVKQVALLCGIHDLGYRVISNTGEDGGQTIHHIHFHVLGGKKLNVDLI